MSAIASGDPHYIIESFRFAAATIRVRLRAANALPAAEVALLQRNLSGMAEQLRGEIAAAAPERAATVLRDIEALIEQLDQVPQA